MTPPVSLIVFKRFLIDVQAVQAGPISFFLHYEVADQMEQPIVDLLVAHCLHWENVSLEVPGIAIRGLLKIEAWRSIESLTLLGIFPAQKGRTSCECIRVSAIMMVAAPLRTVRVNNFKLVCRAVTKTERLLGSFGDGVRVLKAFGLNSNLRHIKFSSNHDE